MHSTMSRWVTIALCVAGLVLAGYVVATSGQKVPDLPPVAAPTVNPFADGIAASGTVEATSRNLSINAPVGGLVIEVLADVNDRVTAGQALFKLDDRELRAELPRQEAALAQAEAEVSRLRAMPRDVDLPPLRAAVERAKTHVADAQEWYDNLRAAAEDQAANPKELRRAWFALDFARKEQEIAEADLKKAEAGAWDEDIKVAEAKAAGARAEVEGTKALIERLTVKAPVAGTILKRNVEPGRFAATDPASPAMVMGSIEELNIRAQVDEEDLPRLREGAAGIARVRGAAEKKLVLKMVRIEPLAVPKVSLTGAVTERVDTRVVEVLFRVASLEGMRLYPGQVVDVYIDASAAPAGGAH
jgi:multidrug resistance efflux pump